MQNIIDRKYYRQKFDYKKAQSELTKLFSTRRTIESLAQIIIEKLSELVHLKRVGISFFTDEKNIWEEAIYCYNRKNSEKIYINTPFAIISIVQKFSRTFSVEYFHEGVREFLKKNKFYYAHPVCTSGKCLGVIFIGEKLSETELKDYDIEFLNSVSGNISVAIENIFLLEELTKQERIKHELELARRIQVASLPQKVPNINGLDIAAISIPAQEVGGDFYDFLNGSLNDLTVVVGDVSGKGTSAALYMSKIQGIFQTLHEFRLSPQNLLIRANRLLYKHIDSKSYITAIGANFLTDKCILTFSRAGHLPLLYYNSEKNSIEKLRPNGIGLGLSEEDVFNNSIEEIKIKYLPGDIFLFFSDGITESRNKLGIQFGEDKLIEIFMENKESDSQKICDSIIKSIHLFSSDTSQFDDITLVVVKSI